jgi:heme A synthase
MIDLMNGSALELPYNFFDYSLLTTGWIAVILYGYAIKYYKGSKSDTKRAHLLLGFHVIAALFIFAWRIGQNPLLLPIILFNRVVDGSITRQVF